MLELRAPIASEDREALEFYLFESEELHPWIMYDDVKTGEMSVQGIFESEEEALATWKGLAAVLSLPPEPEIKEVEDKDWKESYKEHFQPWTIGDLHWVPLWMKEEYHVPAGNQAVYLDPGMAFGTGNHETTRLCVERLIDLVDSLPKSKLRELKVIDAGCGSGILAVSAAKVGFEQVSGFDNDPDAIQVSNENKELNETSAVDFYVGDLVTGFKDQPYDVVMANILAPILIQFRELIVAALAPGATLILSGILTTEAAKVKEAFEPLKPWRSVAIDELGEWTSVTLKA